MIERIPIGDRSAWLALRRRDVTASDIAALFGAHPFKTKLQVWAAKAGPGWDEGDNSAMRRGRILEPGCIVALQEEHPDWIIAKSTDYVRDASLRLGCTPDYTRWVDEPRHREMIECKTAAPDQFERDWQAGPPLAYTLQALTQAMLCEAERAWIALIIDNRAKDFRLYEVPRHAGAEAKIREAVAAFWRDVEAGVRPEPADGRDAAVLASMFPRDNGSALDLSADNHLPEVLAERAVLKAEIGARETRVDEIDAEIKSKLGEAAEGRLNGWRLTWKTQHRKEQHLPAKDIRVLRVTDLRAKETAL